MEKKQKTFEKIIKEYLIAKKALALIEEGYGDLVEKDNPKDFERQVRFVKKNVELTLVMLDDDSRKILENEFILPNRNFWWAEMYSKSTYYRYRSRAIETFIDFYYR